MDSRSLVMLFQVSRLAPALCAVLAGLVACSGADNRRAAATDTAGAAGSSGARASASPAQPANAQCDPDNGGITLPEGFCATLFADEIGGARHITIAPNGDVFVTILTSERGVERGSGTGGIAALRDTNSDGRADVRQYFGDLGGTGIQLVDTLLYADAGTAIVRYRLPRGSLRPAGGPDTVVADLPTGGHEAHNMVLDSAGTTLYVNVGSRTNACQVKDRAEGSPGHDPCTELETRAGIWQFATNRLRQRQQDGVRFATGNRNAMGLAFNPVDGRLYATQHGRDQLAQNWPKLFTFEESAENPAEELMQVSRGDDFGWPYCYYSVDRKALVLAPEYGGDGTRVGRCAQKKGPVVVFPGHWAPMSLLFYSGTQFPARYRNGAFIAFHGSWNRAPEPQAGYRVSFVPMAEGRLSSDYETFADDFAGGRLDPGAARHRPVGLAQGPDGALYITDDQRGRIWKVLYRRGEE